MGKAWFTISIFWPVARGITETYVEETDLSDENCFQNYNFSSEFSCKVEIIDIYAE